MAATYSAKRVATALMIPHGTLNSWAHEGYFSALDGVETVPGKARAFTLLDVMRISLMVYLIRRGESPALAAEAMNDSNVKSWMSYLLNFDFLDDKGAYLVTLQPIYETGRRQFTVYNDSKLLLEDLTSRLSPTGLYSSPTAVITNLAGVIKITKQQLSLIPES